MDTLYYWRKSKRRANFGDYIGSYLFQKITSRPSKDRREDEPHWVTVGSLLGNQHVNELSHVWGSGILTTGACFPRPAIIHAVRGPYSAQRCQAQGYPVPKVQGDPALLLPRFYKPKGLRQDVIGIIFHHRHKIPSGPVPPGLRYISLVHPDGDDILFEAVLESIATCRAVASSSLHGLIVAHAYGIPALWCAFPETYHCDNIKFLDYYHALGVTAVQDPRLVTSPDSNKTLWQTWIQEYPQPTVKAITDCARQLWVSCPFR